MLDAGLGWAFHVPAKQAVACNIFLTRHVDRASAVREAQSAKSRVVSGYAEKRSEDDWFWSQAPRLEGDFPQHWKHSWVYDFETLRMMVRRRLAEGGALRISLRAQHPHLPRRDLVGGAFVLRAGLPSFDCE